MPGKLKITGLGETKVVDDTPANRTKIQNAQNDGHEVQVEEIPDVDSETPQQDADPMPPAPQGKTGWAGALEGAQDFATGAGDTMTLGLSDELAGLINPSWKDKIRAQVQLAHERSPVMSRAGDVAGAVGLGTITGGFGGGGALAALGRNALMGGLSGAGHSNGENMGQEALTGAVAGGGLGLAANGINRVVPAAFRAVPQMTNKLKEYGVAIPDALSSLAKGAGSLSRGVGAFANGVRDYSGSAVNALEGMTSSGGALHSDVAAPVTPDTNSKVAQVLQTNPQALGKYAQELQQASGDEEQLKAAIIRLTQNDPDFRTQVLPNL